MTHRSWALAPSRSRGQRVPAAQRPLGPSPRPPGLDSAPLCSRRPAQAPASCRCQVRRCSARCRRRLRCPVPEGPGRGGTTRGCPPTVTSAQQPGRSRGSHGICAQRGAVGIDLGLIRVPALFLHNDFPFATGKKGGGGWGVGGGARGRDYSFSSNPSGGRGSFIFPGPFTSSARARRLSQAPRRGWSSARAGGGGAPAAGSQRGVTPRLGHRLRGPWLPERRSCGCRKGGQSH